MTLQKTRLSNRPARWDDVEIGDAVHLRRDGRVEYEGRVDNRTADGAVVWVVAEAGRRQLFHAADGFELRLADPEGALHAGN